MLTIDVRALALPRTTGRCPACRGTDVGWFGILRVCRACHHVFHWRDAATESWNPSFGSPYESFE